MGSSHGKIIFSICLVFILGCTDDPKVIASKTYKNDVELLSGDLIFRFGKGYFSNQFRKRCSIQEKIYSHGGVIHVENDSIMVYHAEASELTGVGFVKKESIQTFLNDIDTYGFYRIDCENPIKEKIIERVDYYFKKNTRFDLKFDITNDDEVYCSELVANAINYAFGKQVIIPNIDFGGKKVYGVDNLYLNEGFHLVYKTEN